MTISTLRKGTLVAAAAIALAGPAIAFGAAPQKADASSVKVSYKDLDVTSEAGAKILYARLKQASKSACDVRPVRETGSISATAKAKQCYHNSLAEAVDRLDIELVSKLHAT